MHYLYKFAPLALGFGLLSACDRQEEQISSRIAEEDPIACGGFAGLECPYGLVCVDDPNDDCAPPYGADCGGICVDPGVDPGPITCGGFAGLECPEGLVCVDDPNDDCDPKTGGADCGGICEPGPSHCGGFAGTPCADGEICVDDPSDDCNPEKGGADCIGICEPEPVSGPDYCGGFGGIPCDEGEICVDDPSDNCNPGKGGADCSGICLPGPKLPILPKCDDPDRHYVSHSPKTCMLVKFKCDDGQTLFSDACGCGCES